MAVMAPASSASAQTVVPIAGQGDLDLEGTGTDRAGYQHAYGDLNADGFSDLVVAAPRQDGLIRVYFRPSRPALPSPPRMRM